MEAQSNNVDVTTAGLIEELELARAAGDEQRVQELEAILNGDQSQDDEATEAEGSVASEPAEAGEASA